MRRGGSVCDRCPMAPRALAEWWLCVRVTAAAAATPAADGDDAEPLAGAWQYEHAGARRRPAAVAARVSTGFSARGRRGARSPSLVAATRLRAPAAAVDAVAELRLVSGHALACARVAELERQLHAAGLPSQRLGDAGPRCSRRRSPPTRAPSASPPTPSTPPRARRGAHPRVRLDGGWQATVPLLGPPDGAAAAIAADGPSCTEGRVRHDGEGAHYAYDAVTTRAISKLVVDVQAAAFVDALSRRFRAERAADDTTQLVEVRCDGAEVKTEKGRALSLRCKMPPAAASATCFLLEVRLDGQKLPEALEAHVGQSPDGVRHTAALGGLLGAVAKSK